MPIIEVGEIQEFPYVIFKHDTMGHLCGYLAVYKTHPWYDKDELYDVDVHGGITYTARVEDVDLPSKDIKDHYWVGFDCAHYNDFIPGSSMTYISGEVFRNRDFVYNELVELAKQADKAERD
jgi:hypothetical protein